MTLAPTADPAKINCTLAGSAVGASVMLEWEDDVGWMAYTIAHEVAHQLGHHQSCFTPPGFTESYPKMFDLRNGGHCYEGFATSKAADTGSTNDEVGKCILWRKKNKKKTAPATLCDGCLSYVKAMSFVFKDNGGKVEAV